MTTTRFAAHPALLGFDRLDALVERIAKSGADGYPPFNIERTGESGLRITLAVGGLRRGRPRDPRWRTGTWCCAGGARRRRRRASSCTGGIATRQFQRSFVLADGVEVRAARLADGLLHVDLERSAPENRCHPDTDHRGTMRRER